uniref:YLP motif-containing protein 1 n=1 Tax=Cyprinus carpio TaxID=7962 RepID=A0A8C1RFA8_CYPCA
MSLQEQQEYWYQQHRQNLQKLKNEKAKQNQNSSNGSNAPAPPPPVEPPKSTPPPPPPKEEPPPPPPPEESKPSGITDTGDPAEAARLQQLQAAAAHWQHVQHQRASIQYQALMQEHAQLQHVLQQYQQVIQQPAHLQTMPFEMQLQHYEMQQQRFAPLYQEWDRHFNLWLEQFQTYPHKDQLHDYEAQWRQWQEQMNSTSAHLQERVASLRAMQHQYGAAPSYGGIMGPYGQHRLPGPDGNMHLANAGLPSMPPPVKMDAMPGPPPQVPPPSGPVIPQGPSPAEPFPSSGSNSVSEIGKTAGPPGLGATNLLSETGQTNQHLEAGLPSSNQSAGFLHSSSSPAPTASFIAKTVDYGHGRDAGSTVERISYGERIVLRPAPLPSERSYEKELLGHRDPYYDRRSDPYGGPRDYDRDWERDPYREKPHLDYERDRYERDRFLREERDRERDHPSRSSRDREVYNRTSYDRSSYERSDRRSYPDERPPPPTSLPPSAPVAPPRVERKPETKNAEDILKPPGRSARPDRIVVIMRGLPGSGKSHVAKLIRDKEVECGGAPPRVLGLDDYFMTEVEKVEKDPDSGKRFKSKVLEYEYEPEMEETYRSSMLKTFKKTLDDGFFPFIILDAINDKVKYFDQFWSAAKTKGFEVYLAEITTDHQTCAKRNIHGRTLKDITKLASGWESAPPHMVRLDIRSLLQDAAIEDVMFIRCRVGDDFRCCFVLPDKLDGLAGGGKRKRETDVSGMEDFLQLPDDYASRMSEPGKKRVRWADLEEKKDADRKRAIGFVVGQTDWEKITDESGQLAQRALNRTKYF